MRSAGNRAGRHCAFPACHAGCSRRAASPPERAWSRRGSLGAPPGLVAATVAPETSAATRIATPGDPAVTIEQSAPAKPANAKPDKSAVKKHTQTQRAKAHRHARLARQAIPQEPGDPFGLQPTITTRATR